MCQCLRPMQPLNIRIPGPDRNAHLVILLGNLLSLKKGQQNFSANLEGSHTDQSFFRNKCTDQSFFRNFSRVTENKGGREQIQDPNIRGREHLRETAWMCWEVAGDARMEEGLVGNFLLIIQTIQKVSIPGGCSLLQDEWLGDSASLV